MSNEALQRDKISEPLNFACTETAMEKGTILKLSGARAVGPSSADNDPFAGILAREKIAGDGRVEVPVFVDGIFDCYFDSAVTAGQDVTISGANILKAYTTLDDEKGYVVGKALEDVTGSGTIQVLVGCK